MGAGFSLAEASERHALAQLTAARQALDAAGIPAHDDGGAPLTFGLRLAVALDQRAGLVELGWGLAHTAGELDEFRSALGLRGVHLPVEGSCYACGRPWPCRLPGVPNPASPASSFPAAGSSAPVGRAGGQGDRAAAPDAGTGPEQRS